MGAWGGGTCTCSAWPSSAGPWAPVWAPGEARSFLSLLWANLRRLGRWEMSPHYGCPQEASVGCSGLASLQSGSPPSHSGQLSGLRLPAAMLLADHS